VTEITRPEISWKFTVFFQSDGHFEWIIVLTKDN